MKPVPIETGEVLKRRARLSFARMIFAKKLLGSETL
jgi:hypothetical protein